MLHKLLQLFGVRCRHRRLSHPFATAQAVGAKSDQWENVTAATGHYVVCLDCGHKFQYDWSNMRVMW